MDFIINKNLKKPTQGAIGENLVLNELLNRGWKAFNANAIIPNFPSIDLICYHEKMREQGKRRPAFIQVKTMIEKKGEHPNFPTGFSLEEATDKKILEEGIIGPYVFVLQTLKNEIEFYILSRRQIIDLLYESNNYYYKPEHHKGNAPAGVKLLWIRGSKKWNPKIGDEEFDNPLYGQSSAKDNWDNIWKD